MPLTVTHSSLAIPQSTNVRHVWRWAFEIGEFFLPDARFFTDWFQHVVPQCIGGSRITFLTQMKAVQRHVAEVGVAVRVVGKREIHNERLKHNSEIRLVVEFLPICNIHLQKVPLLDQFNVSFLFPAKSCSQKARAFDYVHRDALLWFSLEPG